MAMACVQRRVGTTRTIQSAANRSLEFRKGGRKPVQVIRSYSFHIHYGHTLNGFKTSYRMPKRCLSKHPVACLPHACPGHVHTVAFVFFEDTSMSRGLRAPTYGYETSVYKYK